MTDETITPTGPQDAESKDRSGLPAAPSLPDRQAGAAQGGEVTAKQNVLGQDAESKLETAQVSESPKPEIAPAAPLAADKPAPLELPAPPQEQKKDMPPEMSELLAKIKLPARIDLAKEGILPPEKAGRVFDTALMGESSQKTEVKSAETPPIQAAKEIPSQEKDVPSEKPSLVSSLRTLKDDIEHTVRDKNISLVRTAAFEQEKRHRAHGEEAPAVVDPALERQRKSVFIVSLIAFLFLSGIAALFYIYIRVGEDQITAASPIEIPIIFAERTIPFPMDTLSDIDIKRYISQALKITDSSLGSITRIVPQTAIAGEKGEGGAEPATIQSFFSAINAPITPELSRALKGDFFLGIHTIDKNVPIFIVPVSSYERAFAEMLKWENSINADLVPIFTPVPRQTLDESGLLVDREFRDVVIKNYDVRALVDDSGNIQMLYAFPARTILIITESPNSFVEILSRLRASRQL